MSSLLHLGHLNLIPIYLPRRQDVHLLASHVLHKPERLKVQSEQILLPHLLQILSSIILSPPLSLPHNRLDLLYSLERERQKPIETNHLIVQKL